MTICSLDSDLVPSSCPDLQMYLQQLMRLLPLVDQIKYGSGADEPTWQDLANLWGGCDVPAGAFAFWYNTTAEELGWWVCPTGDYYELA